VPTGRKDLLNHFQRDFLFAGSGAAWLFWGGVLLMVVGIARNLSWRR